MGARVISKSANKRAIRRLPALRASLLWFKRETVRHLERRAQEVSSPRLQAWLTAKARKLRATELADLRSAYQAERVNEIAQARRFELSRAVPGIAWLSAELDSA